MARSALRWFAALTVLAVPLVGPGTSADAAVGRFLSGWVPYWNSADGRASFSGAEAPMFEDISPFFSTANSDGQIGTLNTAAFQQTIDDAHARGMTVLPSITDGTGNQMAALLGTPGWLDAHVANIVAWIAKWGVDGVDLDYEGFAFSDNAGLDDATVSQRWIAFVKALSAALPDGKLLSITIPPEWGVSWDYKLYAQGTLWPYVDRIRLMVYDWSVSSPGPIAPTSWAQQVISTSDALVGDHSKLVLGIPAYGRNWAQKVNSGELCPTGSLRTTSVATGAGAALAAAHGVTPVRDTSGELKFSWTETVTGILVTPVPAPPYTPAPPAMAPVSGGLTGDLQPAQRLGTANQTVTCTIKHTVYYPDATSIKNRAMLAKSAGWRGAVIWALGFEDQATRTALYDVAQT